MWARQWGEYGEADRVGVWDRTHLSLRSIPQSHQPDPGQTGRRWCTRGFNGEMPAALIKLMLFVYFFCVEANFSACQKHCESRLLSGESTFFRDAQGEIYPVLRTLGLQHGYKVITEQQAGLIGKESTQKTFLKSHSANNTLLFSASYHQCEHKLCGGEKLLCH